MTGAGDPSGSTLEAHRLRATLDVLREGSQILLPQWRYLCTNDAVARHARKTTAELRGKTILEGFPGIERTPMFAVLERCRRDRAPESIENEGSTGPVASELGWKVQPTSEATNMGTSARAIDMPAAMSTARAACTTGRS